MEDEAPTHKKKLSTKERKELKRKRKREVRFKNTDTAEKVCVAL
jgi:hypothetical protein